VVQLVTALRCGRRLAALGAAHHHSRGATRARKSHFTYFLLSSEKRMAKSKATDAIALLKADHDEVKQAFKEFEKMDHEDDAAVEELVSRVCEALKAHTIVEEEIFYPAARAAIDDDDLMNEAQVEHNSAKELIELLEGMDPTDPMYSATFTVLGEYVLHHAKEEEDEMFPAARKAKLDLEGLGEQIQTRKAELTESEAA
jgi:hemerythrin superfamily protein